MGGKKQGKKFHGVEGSAVAGFKAFCTYGALKLDVGNFRTSKQAAEAADLTVLALGSKCQQPLNSSRQAYTKQQIKVQKQHVDQLLQHVLDQKKARQKEKEKRKKSKPQQQSVAHAPSAAPQLEPAAAGQQSQHDRSKLGKRKEQDQAGDNVSDTAPDQEQQHADAHVKKRRKVQHQAWTDAAAKQPTDHASSQVAGMALAVAEPQSAAVQPSSTTQEIQLRLQRALHAQAVLKVQLREFILAFKDAENELKAALQLAKAQQ